MRQHRQEDAEHKDMEFSCQWNVLLVTSFPPPLLKPASNSRDISRLELNHLIRIYSYLCSAEERQADVAEGPKGFPYHFCLLDPTSGLKSRDLYLVDCYWLLSPGRFLPALKVVHSRWCSRGHWYLRKRYRERACIYMTKVMHCSL